MVKITNHILVVAPHPDDETYGCGGTLLRHAAQGDHIHWLIVTAMSEQGGYANHTIKTRNNEIDKIKTLYEFHSTHCLNFPTAELDKIPTQELVKSIASVLQSVKPNYIYIPHRGDIHTDHQIVFDATIACTKWFRYEFIEKVFSYETLSETDFNLNPNIQAFTPNRFINIEHYLEKKIAIAKTYASEYGTFPFPRSEQGIRALANFRGSLSGFNAAEAFILLKERVA